MKLKNLAEIKSKSEGKIARNLAAVDKVQGKLISLFLFPKLFTTLSATLDAEIASLSRVVENYNAVESLRGGN